MAILQQTHFSDGNADESLLIGEGGGGEVEGPTVLEDVIDKATAKSELEQEINGIFFLFTFYFFFFVCVLYATT